MILPIKMNHKKKKKKKKKKLFLLDLIFLDLQKGAVLFGEFQLNIQGEAARERTSWFLSVVT